MSRHCPFIEFGMVHWTADERDGLEANLESTDVREVRTAEGESELSDPLSNGLVDRHGIARRYDPADLISQRSKAVLEDLGHRIEPEDGRDQRPHFLHFRLHLGSHLRP